MGDDTAEVLAAFVGGIVFELSPEGRYLRILSGDSQLLARPASELLGKTVREVLGSEAAPFEGIVARVSQTGEVETFEYTLDVVAGRRRFRSEARRRSPNVILLVRDVTEETELRAKLIAAERLAAVGTVAASIAHEIRQPLAFARTSVEVLAGELVSPPPSRRAADALAHVRDAVARISEIAASVGMVANNRPSPHATTTVRAPVDAALDLCASELRGRTHVCVDIADDMRVRAPEAEVCRVLSNVILNAAQAMDPSLAADNEIRIYAERLDEMVRIAVRDNGNGIPADVVSQVFDPFFTTKEEGSGSGLGLYLSQRIVERWGGRIGVTSKVRIGTTVTIDLPADAGAVRPPAPPPAEADRRQLSILVVDDENLFLRSLELLLEGLHEVTTSPSAPRALALLRSEPKRFDAVLCDLSMPDIDGIAFYEQMERLGIADRFVLMTGGAYTPRAAAFLDNVQCARIAKPFTPDQLERVLASVARSA